jgi:hypothetical protein
VVAEAADAAIQQAIADMRASPDPSSISFQVAAARLVDACTKVKR